MFNERLGKWLSFSFIGACFCLGIGIGMSIRFGQIQRSQAATSPIETVPDSFFIPETVPSDSITV